MVIATATAEEGVNAAFADGYSGMITFRDLPEIGNLSHISDVELPNLYVVILTTTQEEAVGLPWDFVRHYCDPSYRVRMELVTGPERQTLGDEVRRFRESAGLTQKALAQSAGIARITLVRLENGKRTPKLDTLWAIATALELRGGRSAYPAWCLERD